MLKQKYYLMRKIAVLLMIFILFGTSTKVVAEEQESEDYFDMSIEELMEVEVVSASLLEYLETLRTALFWRIKSEQ